VLFVVVELLLTGGRQRLIYFDHGWLLLLVVVLLSLILAHRLNQGISPVHMRIILVQEGKQPLNLVIPKGKNVVRPKIEVSYSAL